MEPQLKLLPIGLLITSGNIRYDYGDLMVLASTFIDGQPDSPPIVHQNERGYVVEEGNRRVKAAELIGTEMLWCVVKPTPPDSPKMRQLIADYHHKSLTPLERAEALQAITAEAPDLTQAQLGEMLGISQTEASQTLGLLDLCQGAQQALQDGIIGMGIAELLMPLDRETQGRVLPEILKRKGQRTGKPTVAQARRVISEATMTEEEQKAREDAALATAIRNHREPRPELMDAFYRMPEADEPEQTAHTLMLYEVMRAEETLTSAWETWQADGCSPALRDKISRAANRIKQLAKRIEEATR